MQDNSSNTKRIATNSMLMYIRMAVVMVVKLYTLRVVIKVLGVEDYGLYNVIAGVVTMLHSVTSILSASTQRFYSYAIGEQNNEQLQDVYNVSLNLFVFFALGIIIVGETIGLWFVNSYLTIPVERLVASNWLYQLTIVSFCVMMFQIPYLSAVIAHEDMKFFALVNTLESFFILLLVYFINYISFDHLILYGFIMLIVPVISTMSYVLLCKRNYNECKRCKVRRGELYREMLSFSGWTMLSPLASVGINQVCTILVNIFFGPIINGARGIAFQLSNALNSFCSSFLMAIRPPMIKSYAEKNFDYLTLLFNMSNKFIYYSLLILCVPVFFEMESILGWWLKVNDETTVLFSRLLLVYVVIMSLNNPIGFIIQATGKIKRYTIYVETFTFLCAPVTYMLFKCGLPAYTTFVVMIVCAVLSHIVRVICLKRLYPPFEVRAYVLNFLLIAVMVTFVISVMGSFIHNSINSSVVRLVCMVVFCSLSTIILSYCLGLSKIERRALRSLLKHKM